MSASSIVRSYAHRWVLGGDPEALTGFVADRLGVSSTEAPRPRGPAWTCRDSAGRLPGAAIG